VSLRPILIAGIVFLPFPVYVGFAKPTYEARARVNFVGGGSLEVSHRDADAGRAQAGATELAKRTAFVAERVARGDASPSTDRAARELALAGFVAEHPELRAPSVPSASPPLNAGESQARLEIERGRVQRDLERALAAPPASDSDNPYDSVAVPQTGRFKRRLAEIDGQLKKLRDAAVSAPAPAALPLDELGRLIAAVRAAAPERPPSTTPVAVAGVAGAAVAITPSRTLALGIGAVLATLAGILLTLFGTSAPQRGPATLREPARRPFPTPASARAPLSVPPPSRTPVVPTPATPATHASPASAPRLPPPAPLPDLPAAPDPVPGVESATVVAYPIAWASDPTIEEAIDRALLSELRALSTPDGAVVLVVGSTHAETAAARLAASLSLGLERTGDVRVLLLEADFENPGVHQPLNVTVPVELSFGTQLEARVAGVDEGQWHVLKCTDMLHVLPAVRGSPDLVLSRHFESSVAALRPYYDVVLIHGPPTSNTVRCRALADVVDGVLVAHLAGDVDSERALAGFAPKRLRKAVTVPPA
jgi:Mrp family chromosome partitioning ATPase